MMKENKIKGNHYDHVPETENQAKEIVPTGSSGQDAQNDVSLRENHSSQWAEDIPAALHSQTVGQRGPVLEQDNILHETLETFVHTKIIERPVHVKGFGAFGYFQTIHSMTEFTKLSFLQNPGQQVPVTVRFSLAVSNKGTPDTSRNVRGFSTKFYTEEGIFDLVCNHIPVFSVRDAIRFPESIKAFLPSPKNNLIDPERFWSFVARAPESTHFLVWLYSDVGTVKSLRHMKGHSVNTYVWRNARGVRTYIKYHWMPFAGEQYIDRHEAARLAGENPDIAGKDLYDTIAAGKTVDYGLYVQLMNPDDAATLPFDPLDDTKVWDEQQYPLLPVGRLVLNINPDNYMEQVEKIAFSPSNLLDGAELSDDKMLQGRANIYWDSQRRRLGPEFRKIPVNHQEDWSPASLVTSGNGRFVEGDLERTDLAKPDNFTQAGQFYRALSPMQQDHLVDNLSADLAGISHETQSIVLDYLTNASAELGEKVAKQLKMNKKE
ncbi:catalase [Paenibacillus dokdonensis]|uniref:catalase n=1 Tax=Paenibacillus dokdonensis TaxID=2567944 RepID=UPI001FE26B1B|nr:catalase [Paenibacillus dokdonensis]